MTAPTFLDAGPVTLHPVEEADVQFLQRIENDPAVRHGLSVTTPRRAADERESYVEAPDHSEYFVVRADGDRVGRADLVHIDQDNGVGETGYLFAPEAWGNGYATASVEAIVEYAFTERRLNKVQARAYEFNEASARVLAKAGFTHEATLREQVFRHGEYVDTDLYGLLAEEWAEKQDRD